MVVALAGARSLRCQVESVEATPSRFVWVSHGRLEGHLALEYSPAGAFSPDSTTLAVVSEDKVVLMKLSDASVEKVLKPRLPGLSELEIQSANFLEPDRLFLLATGLYPAKSKGAGGSTPLLGFQWDITSDSLAGKVNSIGIGGGFGQPHYLSDIGNLVLYKDSNFDLWNPRDGRLQRVTVTQLTHRPHLYAFSPDGHWLLLARIETSGTPDPVVVQLRTHEFVDSLRGHHGTVLSLSFSRDGKRVVTACEDGEVRIWSAPDWKLLHAMSGHQGPVLWAEFSPDGNWVVSGGEDRTVRVWSSADGKLQQTLEESQAPVRTVAFSPNGEYIAASSEQVVLVWQRSRVD
jgi:WD40 repeat protein